MKITFRGTSDALCVPRLYCNCAVCEEARAGGSNRRSRSSITIEVDASTLFWVDCGPDWYQQMEQANIRVITKMLITHPHYDHIGGLPQWYDQCRYNGSEPELYAAQEVIDEILTRFPWLSSNISFIPLDKGVEFGDWSLNVWRVNHGRNGYSYSFKFKNNMHDRTFVYCPDCILLSEEEQRELFNVNIIIMGASFLKEMYAIETRSLYDVMELIELNEIWQPDQFWITHMSHDIDVNETSHLPSNMKYAKIAQEIEI